MRIYSGWLVANVLGILSEKLAFLHFSCALFCILFLNILLALNSSSGILEFFLCFILHLLFYNFSLSFEFFCFFLLCLVLLYSAWRCYL